MRRLALVVLLAILGCSSPRPEAPVCDATCQDGIALRAIRESMKLAYNLLLQGKPVGTYDVSSPCPKGGKVRIVGSASSNSVQGATIVDLTYTFEGCGGTQKQSDTTSTYDVVLTGKITQQGTLAVQPSATSAALFRGTGVTLTGTVSDPPLPYDAEDCALEVAQNGNVLGGTICGRTAAISL